MSSDSLTLAVTSGFGVGIIAGIVSGMCYVLVHGFVRKRPPTSGAQWNCSICGLHFRSIKGVLQTGLVVTCEKCGASVCKTRCSNRNFQDGWICQSCQHPESWFRGILRMLHPNSVKVGATKTAMDSGRINEVHEDLVNLKEKENEEVRDFIERLIEAMLGSSIDNASVTRLYSDKKYDVFMSRYQADLSSHLIDLGSTLHMSIAIFPAPGAQKVDAQLSRANRISGVLLILICGTLRMKGL